VRILKTGEDPELDFLVIRPDNMEMQSQPVMVGEVLSTTQSTPNALLPSVEHPICSSLLEAGRFSHCVC